MAAQQILDGIFHEPHRRFKRAPLFDRFEMVADELQRRLVKIQKLKARVVGQQMFVEKVHRLPRGTAAERKNIRRAAAAHHATGLLADFLFQKTDAIAHRAAGRMVEQVGVDEPGVKRLALETVADNHAHHFVVAGVAQRLGVSAVKKWRAQKIRMQLPPAKRAVRRAQFLGDGVGHRFKTLKKTGQRGQHRRA